MRRLMAQEAAEAKARGELIEETSASDWSSADDPDPDDDNPEDPVGLSCGTAQDQLVKSKPETYNHHDAENMPKELLRVKSKRLGDETGNEADMDDTSMSSRASSRMLESINVMSMDSMNVMYDSEYDDLRLASASAGGPIMSDFESDLPPELDIDLNNVLDNLDNNGPAPNEASCSAVQEKSDEIINQDANDDDIEPVISTLVEEPLETTTSNNEKVEDKQQNADD